MKKNLLFLLITTVFFVGCSGKKYYEPAKSSYFDKKQTIESSIEYFNNDVANLNNKKFIYANLISKEAIKEGFKVLNVNDSKILASDNTKNIMICEDSKCETFDVGNPVVAASIKNNILALVFWDNSIALFDINNKKFTFREYAKSALACDIRIANPKFMTDIVLFPMLDGKIAVVNSQKNEKLRDILVDIDGEFNNVFYIDSVSEVLVASTRNSIVSLSSGTFNIKPYEISEIITDQKNIWITTLDGKIMKLDLSLNEVKSSKFKYAKFVALSQKDDFIYALESNGYLIKIKKDFSSEEVFSLSLDKKDKIFSNKNTIITGDTKIIF